MLYKDFQAEILSRRNVSDIGRENASKIQSYVSKKQSRFTKEGKERKQTDRESLRSETENAGCAELLCCSFARNTEVCEIFPKERTLNAPSPLQAGGPLQRILWSFLTPESLKGKKLMLLTLKMRTIS